MASVHRHPGSPYFYARFKGADGKWKSKSTKLKKKADALRLAHDWERAEPDDKAEAKPGTVREYLEEYVAAKRAQGRTKLYCNSILKMVPRIVDVDMPLKDLTARHIDRGIDQLDIGANSQRNAKDIICAFLNYCFKKGYCQQLPVEARRVKDSDVKYDRGIFYEGEVDRLIETTANSEHVRAGLDGRRRSLLYRTIYDCALRRSEAARITWTDLSLSRKEDSAFLRVEGKGGKVSKQPITESLFVDLINLMTEVEEPPSSPIFPFRYQSIVSPALKKDMEDAGIPKVASKKIRDLHSLRKTRISALADEGVPPHILRQFARHSNITLTMQVYAEADSESIRKYL